MRFSKANLFYACKHPLRAIRYFKVRDRIAYSEIARYLPADPVILEAGAANGTNTLEMAEFWPGSKIHAFEPVPAARAAAEQRLVKFVSRARVYPYALGPEHGYFEMNISGQGSADDSQSSSLLEPTGHSVEYGFVSFRKKERVEVVSLDEWAEAHGIATIDFMWLDLQGYELQALSGAKRLLEGTAAIHMEVSHSPLYAQQPVYDDVRKEMTRRGFKVAIESIFRVGGNVLFVKNR